MKLSCLPVSFFSDIIDGRMSVGDWARLGAGLGLDGVDLSILFVPDHSPSALAKVRRDIEDAGIKLVMVTSYPDFTHPDAAQRARELDLEREVVDVAASLGAEYVRVTAGQLHPQTGRAEGIGWAVEGLTRLLEATKDTGVTLVYENHSKPGVWQYTDFCTAPDVFLEIAKGTAKAGLKINFDAGNAAAYADDAVALLDQVVERVATVHASDTQEHGVLKHVLLGTGVTPYVPLFARLQRAGWDGWVCMEEASNLGRDGVAQAAAFVRQAWQAARSR
ncbi:MAG: sugar phosphate isomerase/epimerase family protein [Anaerolineae bacterium]